MDQPLTLEPRDLIGGGARAEGAAPITGATWYTAPAVGDGLDYRFPAGALADARYLTADMLLDGNVLVVFHLRLQEGDDGPRFRLSFAALNQCQARIRMPLDVVDQHRWRLEREGAWLKPLCGEDRVDLAKVDRMTVTVSMKSDRPARWCLTPFTATRDEPPRVDRPVLPAGPLLDELGQSTLHEWPAKSRDPEEVTARLRAQAAAAPAQTWPEGFSRWGGWSAQTFEATGFFRTHHDGRRWWLVDPDGHPFWSAGQDCVRVDTTAAFDGLETALAWQPAADGEYAAIYRPGEGGVPRSVNYLAANFIRAFGAEDWHDRWAEIALAELRRTGFNTVANWSEWEIARAAGFPYVRPIDFRPERTPMVFRDFPDVFSPVFAEDAADYAEQLRETAGDPALIGYFLMNEPTWGFAAQTPAEGMLFVTPSCATRVALADFLRERHGDDRGLAAAWGVETTLAAVADGPWATQLTDAARSDLAAFSTVMVDKLFGGLTDACRVVDPDHLNLGARYYTVPPEWALEGMRRFDLFSVNGYQERVRRELEPASATLGLPVLVGEWHFGALDVGLPGAGIRHVRDQAARGQAFRVYTEDAASLPWCVGVHYFTLYDESALGRFDGENWNIGFVDVCNRPYGPLADAARATHERLYRVALGEVEPYLEAPEYLPPLFS
jgi:hypothetical protein